MAVNRAYPARMVLGQAVCLGQAVQSEESAGTIVIDPSPTLQAGAIVSPTIAFIGTASTLVFNRFQGLAYIPRDFAAGNMLDIVDVAASGMAVSLNDTAL